MKSEHTIDGKRFDLEMHTVHLPDASGRRRLEEKAEEAGTEGIEIFASAMGLIFDEHHYDPTITPEERLVIDKFFDSLFFEAETPGVNGTTEDSESENYQSDPRYDKEKGTYAFIDKTDIPYGDLMDIVNFSNRCVYTGSLTTPPCNVGVYF